MVQESLTNAIKHAPGSTVRVSIARQADRTEVRVTNSAAPAAPAAPESALRLAAARRSTRRRFAAAFAAPVGLALLTLVSGAYLAQQLTTCVLRPVDLAALRPGQDRVEVDRLLPERQFRYLPDAVRALPVPPGTDCAYYRSNGNLLDQVDLYRLCYEGSRLVAKDVLPG
ncbi:hypothetical protein [Streptomyces virginiae]|uniref:hypothetical protein n=1 Tax=Streptomyces virginiae TaxID=1961 RepID=UPI003679B969